MSAEMRAASLSDVGRMREQNEDACFAGRHVFAVADGLGGHSAGEVASTLALDPIAALDERPSRDAARHVADAVRRANRAVFDRAQKDASLKGMGTTMTALVVNEDTAHLAHVGDSRCYLIRKGAIAQLSADHTLVARMVSEGKLTPEQAESHPQRSILTRALGAERDVEVDEAEYPLAPGDRLVLCSDGLTGVMTDEEIRALASEDGDLADVCRSLIDEANARGGPDNITAVIVEITGGGATVAELPRMAAHSAGATVRKIPRRALAWAALVATVMLGSFLGVRAWTNRSFYVGIEGEQVTIYRGLPVEFAGIELAHVEEPTDVRARDVQPFLRSRLEEGIRADSLTDARRIVEEQIKPNSILPTPSASSSTSTSPTPRSSP